MAGPPEFLDSRLCYGKGYYMARGCGAIVQLTSTSLIKAPSHVGYATNRTVFDYQLHVLVSENISAFFSCAEEADLPVQAIEFVPDVHER